MPIIVRTSYNDSGDTFKFIEDGRPYAGAENYTYVDQRDLTSTQMRALEDLNRQVRQVQQGGQQGGQQGPLGGIENTRPLPGADRRPQPVGGSSQNGNRPPGGPGSSSPLPGPDRQPQPVGDQSQSQSQSQQGPAMGPGVSSPLPGIDRIPQPVGGRPPAAPQPMQRAGSPWGEMPFFRQPPAAPPAAQASGPFNQPMMDAAYSAGAGLGSVMRAPIDNAVQQGMQQGAEQGSPYGNPISQGAMQAGGAVGNFLNNNLPGWARPMFGAPQQQLPSSIPGPTSRPTSAGQWNSPYVGARPDTFDVTVPDYQPPTMPGQPMNMELGGQTYSYDPITGQLSINGVPLPTGR